MQPIANNKTPNYTRRRNLFWKEFVEKYKSHLHPASMNYGWIEVDSIAVTVNEKNKERTWDYWAALKFDCTEVESMLVTVNETIYVSSKLIKWTSVW